ncbi:hypothetical protein OE88DRAFT_1726477 [Heliocybe sulcata]|uniref:F-box domain-containing protein n=1 Tax=Heliocybe sulcata TaxID=5364 RepID=A0A5C3MZA4_9AGAM|nr:hypothetical protein OE88DRAFT_1726477 [Heliocybe sulcata]
MDHDYAIYSGMEMPTHIPKCLLITEILVEIFEFVLALEEYGPPTLASLARTCKAFQAPALSILWRDLTELQPLIHCLPQDLWCKDRGSITFRRPIRVADLNRFNFYASFVRSLFTSSPFMDDFQKLLFSALPQLYPSRLIRNRPSILPNILHLRWIAETPTKLSKIYWLLTSSLRTLHFTSVCPEQDTTPFLRHLVETCTALRKLATCFYGAAITESVYVAVCKLVPKLVALKSYSCNAPFAAQVAPALSSLRHLEELQLDFNNTAAFVGSGIQFPIADNPFPSLQRVSLAFNRLSECTDMLNILRPCTLTHAYFSVREYADPSSVTRFLSDLSSKLTLSHASLRHLCLLQNPARLPSDAVLREEYILHGSALLPLRAFTSLRHLRLHVQCGFDIDDDALTTLVAAWPRLRSLHFGVYKDLPRQTKITLGGVASLVRSCPGLANLSLPLDARLSSSYAHERQHVLDSLGTEAIPRNKRIISIYVGESFIQNSPVVAAVLLDIFPRLEWVVGTEVDRVVWSGQRDKWHEVRLAVEKYQAESPLEDEDDDDDGVDDEDDEEEWEYGA